VLTGVQGVQEAAGSVASPEWKKKNLKEEWFPGDAVNQAIGQGYLDASPLQVANAYAVLANGGVLRQPLLVKRIVPGDGSPPKEFQAQEKGRISASAETLAVVRDAMRRVASAQKGTAWYAFKDYKVPVAAKTGSAENQDPNAHAWFAGYGPANDPKIVVTVMVEGGQHGGTVAAPLGQKVFEIVLGK
jgi:penicillin-binding protein 2